MPSRRLSFGSHVSTLPSGDADLRFSRTSNSRARVVSTVSWRYAQMANTIAGTMKNVRSATERRVR